MLIISEEWRLSWNGMELSSQYKITMQNVHMTAAYSL